MAGTVTITYREPLDAARRPVKKLSLAWVSDASGNVSGTLTRQLSGVIGRVVFDPGADAPTDNYDVTLLDEDGVDVLAGQGADLDTATTTHVCPGVPLKDGTTTECVPVMFDGTLELRVANAGSAKGGSVHVYYR